MAEPIIERIAEVIAERLQITEDATAVTRPMRINSEPAGDFKLTLTQGQRTANRDLGYQSNPPVVAFDQIFVIAGELRPSEDDTTSIDTHRNRFESQIRTAITSVTNWHRYADSDGDLAINSEIGVARAFSSDSAAGIKIDLLVQYRHPENDDTTPR
jgi:hypothetical protein